MFGGPAYSRSLDGQRRSKTGAFGAKDRFDEIGETANDGAALRAPSSLYLPVPTRSVAKDNPDL